MQCRVGRQARPKNLRGHGLGPTGNRVAQNSTTVVLHRDARVRGGEVRSHAWVHPRGVPVTARVHGRHLDIHGGVGLFDLRWQLGAVLRGRLLLSWFHEV